MTPPPSVPPQSDPDPGPPPERPRPGGVRVVLVSLAASVAIHALAVVLYTLWVGRIAAPAELVVPPGPPVPPPGVEVVRIAELPEPAIQEVEEPEEPDPEEPEPEPERDPGEPESEEVGEEVEDAPLPSVAERLRAPESGDPRLWRPVDPRLTELTPEQRARLRIYSRLRALSDSMLTEEERARAARDWTYTDDEGNRWGVADGKIYLGDVAIPFPFNFSRPPTVEDGQLQWEWGDIRRGAQDARVWDSWDERSEAIRERRDAERADTSGIDGGRRR